MVIVDFSSVIIANLHAQFGIQNIKVVEEDLLRHMILNTLRAIRVRFKKQDMVIACDRGSWRKSVYPYYKANRKKTKDESGLDWRAIFEVFGKIRSEIRENFPYRVIEVEGAEADDVIAALVFKFGDDDVMSLMYGESDKEEIIIVSPDKDFAQLHVFGNVKQFDPIKKKFIDHKNPSAYLNEHIIRGDSGDGVPNIMSDDDTFVVPGKRQKPMTQKRLEEFMEAIPAEFQRNWERNLTLIDLQKCPESIHQEVLDTYEKQAGKDRSKIFNYMVQNRLRNLLESIQEF